MTKGEWKSCTDPTRMLDWLRPSGEDSPSARPCPVAVSDRKIRLFMCACCRHVWHLLTNAQSRKVVKVAEQFADGKTTAEAMDDANSPVVEMAGDVPNDVNWLAVWASDNDLPRAIDVYTQGEEQEPGRYVSAPVQASLLRDIVGAPFRPLPAVSPSLLRWNGGTIARLARRIYNYRLLPSGELKPDHLAVLADALEDAGCTEPAVLSHLRSPGLHVRGCFAVDWLLGKE
jgi:hypothetical protein